MWKPPNWIEDTNSFKLSGPPLWWRTKLWSFDPSLVVIPSRQSFVYRLAQRRKLTLPNHIVNDSLFKESDTRMLASYSLVPVTTIIATAVWSDAMFQELENRAPWRQGGAEKVIKRIEDMEDEAELKKKFATSQMLTDRAKDGWKLYQSKTGARKFIDSSNQQAWIR